MNFKIFELSFIRFIKKIICTRLALLTCILVTILHLFSFHNAPKHRLNAEPFSELSECDFSNVLVNGEDKNVLEFNDSEYEVFNANNRPYMLSHGNETAIIKKEDKEFDLLQKIFRKYKLTKSVLFVSFKMQKPIFRVSRQLLGYFS